MITVHLETLTAVKRTYTDRKGREVSYDSHTIEISIGSDRRAVRCHPITRTDGDSNISIYELAVRFRTGAKVWPASAVYWLKSGNVNNLRPNIDKFNGQFCQLVGYFADHEDSAHRSQHNAVA
jgi:hypothetical protein